jgi:hypothetical protein
MALERDEITWGATVDATRPAAAGVSEWTVELESEPVGEVFEAALTRFAHDVARLAQGATPTCTLTSGRFGMVLTVEARGSEEAARKGTQIFKSALETAFWPRSVLTSVARHDAFVVPAESFATAA